MIIYQWGVQTGIKYHQNGMDGYLANMMMCPRQAVIVSMILSLKDLTIGELLTLLLEYM